jgi:hypothetical protein
MGKSLKDVTLADVAEMNESEYEIRVYVAVGRAVILWSKVEANFTNLVAHLYHNHGGHEFNPQPPFSVKRKIELWKKCFRSLAPLEPHRKLALQAAKALSDLKTQRDALMHFGWSVGGGDRPMLAGRNLRANPKGHDSLTLDLSIPAINGFCERAIAINLYFVPLAMMLLEPAHRK